MGRWRSLVSARQGPIPSDRCPYGIRAQSLTVDLASRPAGIEDVSASAVRAVAPDPEGASRVRNAETDRVVLRAAPRDATLVEADLALVVDATSVRRSRRRRPVGRRSLRARGAPRRTGVRR